MGVMEKVKMLWHVIVDIFCIVGAVATVLSCIFAFSAVKEIINLNVRILPMVEKLQQDTIIVEKIVFRESERGVVREKLGEEISDEDQVKVEFDKERFKEKMKEALEEYKSNKTK